MTTPMIRGYAVQQANAFLDSYYSREVAAQIRAGISSEVRDLLPQINSASWYPRDYYCQFLRGIAAVKNDETGAHEDLAECGRFIANEATNTYLRLLMRILNPGLFIRKVPTFWKRDQSEGDIAIDSISASDRHIRMRLVGVSGYTHIGPTVEGFVRFGMTAIGAKGVTIEQKGWSLGSPGPAELVYDLRWQ